MTLDISVGVGTQQSYRKFLWQSGVSYHISCRVGHVYVGNYSGGCKESLCGFEYEPVAAAVGKQLRALADIHAVRSSGGKLRGCNSQCRGGRLCGHPDQIQKFQAALIRESVQTVNGSAEHLRKQHRQRGTSVRVVRIELPLGGVRAAFLVNKGQNITHCSAVKLR